MLIVLAQGLIKYAFFEPLNVPTTLNTVEICLLIISTVCIAAAGNVINDIYDTEADAINKPDKCIVGHAIPLNTAFTFYFILNVLGVGLGYYLCYRIGKHAFFSVFVLTSALLYVYSTHLKHIVLIGNIIVSLLVASSILIVGLFELTPALNTTNSALQLYFFNILFYYALFAFIFNLLREIVKDIEDMEGDKRTGGITLPLAIGLPITRGIVLILHSIPTLALMAYCVSSLYKNQLTLVYFLIFIIAPLIYGALKLIAANSKKEFKHISTIYKLVLFFGVLSLLRFAVL